MARSPMLARARGALLQAALLAASTDGAIAATATATFAETATTVTVTY